MPVHAGAAPPSSSPIPLRSAGFLLLISGWAIVAAAIGLLKAARPRGGFVLAGVAVELLGFALVVRSHGFVRRKKP